MLDPCKYCRHRSGCDILAEFCQATPLQIVRLRPDLIKPVPVHTEPINDRRKRISEMGLRKYFRQSAAVDQFLAESRNRRRNAA